MGFPTFFIYEKRMLIMEQMPFKQKKIGTTIAAISTAQGAGGVGMIRISGEHAREIADRVFTLPRKKNCASKGIYSFIW